MAMNVGTDFSSYKPGFTSVEIPQAEMGDFEKHRKESEAIKPKLDEWRANNERIRGGKADYERGVIYDKSGKTVNNATYSINKMSAEDRAVIVDQLKAEARRNEQQLISIVHKTISGQAGAYGKANGNDIWSLLSGGKINVSAAEKAQAQKDIGEDGYWGVKQTSQRLFDFASALAGDDVEKMKKMQAAMEKGFKHATKSWGKDLPGICGETFDAANKLFEEYYRSKESEAISAE